MIVTDRPAWSSEDGRTPLLKSSFTLEPHWKWEDEWFRDLSSEFDDEVMLEIIQYWLKISNY